MAVLMMRIAAPLQAWGDSSRYSRRTTRKEPTKSGILGLLAAATGRRRSDSIEDLMQLRFGVRTDQPGTLLRDFHTAIHPITEKAMPLSQRFYLADAVFVAAVEGDSALIERLSQALQSPKFPLYFGRRSCVPSLPIYIDVQTEDLLTALRETPWQASEWFQNKMKKKGYEAELVYDADIADTNDNVNLLHAGDSESRQDLPLSFDPEQRRYGWRQVSRDYVVMTKGEVNSSYHDPMEVL